MTVDDINEAKRSLKLAWYAARKDALNTSSCWVGPVAQGVKLYSPLMLVWQHDGYGNWRTA